MNLDDTNRIKDLDRSGMLAEIQGLPEQLLNAYRRGSELSVPNIQGIDNIIIAGMGGSAIGADLLLEYISPAVKIPIVVLRDYQLPGWVNGKKSFVICSSHSGNTEETNSVFQQAIERDCTVMVVTTGGLLLSKANEKGILSWQFSHSGQPRAAVGWSFGLLLNLFSRLSLIPDQGDLVDSAVLSMQELQKKIDVDVPTAINPAKRLAGQLIDQYVTVLGAEHLAPVARRWKTQINELAKAWGQFEYLPEADHNTLAGVVNPESLLSKVYTVFLNSKQINLRNQKRIDLTFTEFMVAGLCTDRIDFSAQNKLSEIWTGILFGDFVAYYLAMMYETDPTPVEAIESLKAQMI